MSDQLETTGEVSGLGRRDFIRRSAIVGGMVWAAPVIQSIGRPAFAGTDVCTDISNVAFLLENGVNKYKYEVDDGDLENPPGAPPCVSRLSSVADEPWASYYTKWIGTTASDPTLVDVSPGCTFTITSLLAGGGITLVAVKGATACYYFNYPKVAQVTLTNSFAWLEANADLIISD